MSDWKDIFTLTRHQRVGALVVLAFVGLTLLALWATSLRTSTPNEGDTAAIEQFNATIDSLESLKAQRDSVKKAKASERSSRRKHQTDNKPEKPHKHDSKRPTKKQPPAPRPLSPVPTF